jgi:hypothetical protein
MSEISRPLSLWFDRVAADALPAVATWAIQHDEGTDDYTLTADTVSAGAAFVRSESDPEDFVFSPLPTAGDALKVVAFGDDVKLFP